MEKLLGYINPYMFWIKLAGAALAFAAIFGAGMWLEGTIKDRTILTMERDYAKTQTASVTASLNQLQTFIANMHNAAADYGKNQDVLFAALNKIHADFLKAAGLHPLPPDCKPDSDRLHILSQAIRAANTAASGSGASEAVRPAH